MLPFLQRVVKEMSIDQREGQSSSTWLGESKQAPPSWTEADWSLRGSRAPLLLSQAQLCVMGSPGTTWDWDTAVAP